MNKIYIKSDSDEKSGEEDKVDKEYEIMEEDRKREERLNAARMMGAKKMANEMFEVTMKGIREEKEDQMVF